MQPRLLKQPVPLPRSGSENNGGPPPSAFPHSAIRPESPSITRPKPLPKRPKGRWFVGLILLTIVGLAGYQVWTSFFRYQAYGKVSGRVIRLSPPWDGVVCAVHVKEGQKVRQGDWLVTVENTELRQKHAQLGDELRVAQATLEAEAARLKWQLTFNLDQGRGAIALYYETFGQLLREQSELDYLRTSLERANSLRAGNAITGDEYTRNATQLKGQEQKVAQLTKAVEELKDRAEKARLLLKTGSAENQLAATGYDQLQPFMTRLESVHAERARLQERLDQGRIRAPADGLVVKLQCFPGESCKHAEPFILFLEDHSLQVILYVPQKAAASMQQDQEIDVSLDPYPEPLRCSVIRLGDQFEQAPENLKRFYSEGEKLLPVFLQPNGESERWMALRVGGVVKLPYDWSWIGKRISP